MTKIEAGRTTLNPTSFDLHALLDTLKDIFRLRVQHKGIALRFEPASDLPRSVKADERKLRQVLINLLSNAVKFTSEGHVILRTAYRARPEPRLGFAVED